MRGCFTTLGPHTSLPQSADGTESDRIRFTDFFALAASTDGGSRIAVTTLRGTVTAGDADVGDVDGTLAPRQATPAPTTHAPAADATPDTGADGAEVATTRGSAPRTPAAAASLRGASLATEGVGRAARAWLARPFVTVGGRRTATALGADAGAGTDTTAASAAAAGTGVVVTDGDTNMGDMGDPKEGGAPLRESKVVDTGRASEATPAR